MEVIRARDEDEVGILKIEGFGRLGCLERDPVLTSGRRLEFLTALFVEGDEFIEFSSCRVRLQIILSGDIDGP